MTEPELLRWLPADPTWAKGPDLLRWRLFGLVALLFSTGMVIASIAIGVRELVALGRWLGL